MTPGSRLIADEDGHATVLGAFVVAALAAVLVMVIYVGGAVLARHRAQSAADLSALAAAIDHVAGETNPCAAAQDLTRRQGSGAELVGCRTDGDDVVVTVRVPVELGSFGTSDATAAARAGPVG